MAEFDMTLHAWELESRLRILTAKLESRELELREMRRERAAEEEEMAGLRCRLALAESARPRLDSSDSTVARMEARLEAQAIELRKLRSQLGQAKSQRRKHSRQGAANQRVQRRQYSAASLRALADRILLQADKEESRGKIESLPGPAFVDEPQRTSDWI